MELVIRWTFRGVVEKDIALIDARVRRNGRNDESAFLHSTLTIIDSGTCA